MPLIRHDRAAREFDIDVDGHRGLLQYTLADGLMTITHTLVPPEIGGRGIAGLLVRAALEAARAEGWRVKPACSYAAAFVQRHAGYADLLV